MFSNIYKSLLSILVCSCLTTSVVSKMPMETDFIKIPIETDYSDITYKNTVPFVIPITEGKVIKVYDGDTITIAAKLPYIQSPMYRISVRLNGIDTPEIKGKTQKEKELSKTIRDALKVKIFDKVVQLKNTSTEKYGRLLADVYLDGICINDWLIEQGYAVKYNGGTKERPDEWN